MTELETFTPAEREYFNSRGANGIPTGDAPAEKESDTEAEAGEDEAELEASDDNQTEDKSDSDTEPEAEEEAPKKRDGRVPLRKLRAEEDRRKEVERQVDELREKFSRADERLRMFYESQQRQAPVEQEKEASPPDPTVDPIGAIEWQRQQIEQQRQWQEQQFRVQQEQAAIQQIDNGYRQAWGQFANQQPDAMDAYQHFLKATAAVLRAQGFTKEQADAHVENEERKIAIAAFRSNVNPAEIIYREALEMGYTPKQAERIVNQEEAARKAEEDVARRQKAAPASKSMSSAGGSRSGSAPTVSEIADMSEDEFAEWLAKTPESKRRKIMGE